MSQTIDQAIEETEIKYRLMQSRYNGTCVDCKKPIKEGTDILWAKNVGAKHVICNQTDTPSKTLDMRPYKDKTAYTYIKVHDVKKCQMCETPIDGSDFKLNADDEGYRRVCLSCFRN